MTWRWALLVSVSLCVLSTAGCAVFAPGKDWPEHEMPRNAVALTPTPPAASAPVTRAPAPTRKPQIVISSPGQGEQLDGVQHVVSGLATGALNGVSIWVHSNTGDYLQGTALVSPNGSFQLPVYLGQNIPGRGDHEWFEISARGGDGEGTVSNVVRVYRTR